MRELKQYADVVNDPAFWAAAHDQFAGDFSNLAQDVMQKGALEAERLVGGINFDLVNHSVLTLAGSYTNQWWSALQNSTQNQLRAAIQANITSGAGHPALINSLNPLFGPQRSKVIATTEVTRMYATGNTLAYQSVGIDQVEWQTSEDELVCPICEPLAGERFPAGSDTRPPAHPNCLTPGTVVSSSQVYATSARHYEGEVTELWVGSHLLTVTPNHPILTPKGFVPAGQLTEGDEVVYCSDPEGVTSSIDPDKHQVPAKVEEIVSAFGESFGKLKTRVEVAREDFHGDGEGSKVAVIWADGLLRHERDSALLEPLAEQQLIGGTVRPSPLSSQRPPAELIERSLTAPDSGMSSSSVASVLVRSPVSHHQLISKQRPSPFDFGLGEYRLNSATGEPVTFSQRELGLTRHVVETDAEREVERNALALIVRFPAAVRVERLTKVLGKKFSGHVYNLESSMGYYIANNIITHNCRCWVAPVASDGEALGTTPPLEAPEITTNAELASMLDQMGQPILYQWVDDAERMALNSYQGSGYKALNANLRAGLSLENAQAVQLLDDSLVRYQLPQDLRVFRGIGMKTSAGGLDWNSFAVGDDYLDAAYSSTSIRRKIAEEDFGHFILDIQLPEGQNAIWLSELKQADVGEAEILLPRNLPMKVSRKYIRNVATGEEYNSLEDYAIRAAEEKLSSVGLTRAETPEQGFQNMVDSIVSEATGPYGGTFAKGYKPYLQLVPA